MPYLLTDFGGVALPRAMPEDDLSTGRAETTIAASIGGVYDTFGSRRRYPFSHEFSHRGLYEADTSEYAFRVTKSGDFRVTSSGAFRIVANDRFADLQYQTDALKALVGERGSLWREAIFGGARQWKQCRLLQVNHTETIDQAGAVSEVESVYETTSRAWKAASAIVVNGAATAGVAAPLVIDNSGLMPISDAVFSLARTSGTITQIAVTGGDGASFVWSGNLVSGVFVVDAGNETVTVGGVDAYSGFVLGPTAREWLPIAVGINTFFVTVTGGNANIAMSYYNQWP